jgi:hypothetical protein
MRAAVSGDSLMELNRGTLSATAVDWLGAEVRYGWNIKALVAIAAEVATAATVAPAAHARMSSDAPSIPVTT